MKENRQCTGCSACVSSCPTQSITMAADQEGFEYPHIDKNKCSHCHRCEKVCPLLNNNSVINKDQSKAYAAQNLYAEERKESSSGGVFSLLAHRILTQNGYVCGAVYGKDYKIQHQIINSEMELSSLRGAKYAQSDLGNCFLQIQQILKKEKLVLFVGTPCQVQGLQSFLGGRHENLITVDMICHGVPSPLVWEKYLAARRTKDAKGSPQKMINLRSKESGWSRYAYSVEFGYENGMTYRILQNQDSYMSGFTNNLFLRPSCADCHFKGLKRQSDFTLGDFWGVWDQHPDFDDNIGTSLVFIHTKKGQRLWETIASKMNVREVNQTKSVESNRSAVESSYAHPKRAEFFEKLPKAKFVDELIVRMLQVELGGKVSILHRIFRRYSINERSKYREV